MGLGKCDVIERVQLRFYKHIFKLKKSRPSMPIFVDI